ncbi:MAG: 3-phosphoshikimate 1-carboxyvinyltransferase [Defluviitaleaceae bacterium]|nr:3-phosphoshikimate 1-carboxyvinyltransferase [Defluviitaleaceae bacterium]
MKVTVIPERIGGTIAAIPSKSHLHRLLIFAAFADAPTIVACRDIGAEDIGATIDCLSALGAIIDRNEEGFEVRPVDRAKLPCDSAKPIVFPVGESGSTLRFMLPIVCALGVRGAFEMKGRLPERPLMPLDEQLEAHGAKIWRDGNILHCEGRLTHGTYTLPGDISSQYISGLMMALPLLEKPCVLNVTGNVESAGYITLTLQAGEAFGHRGHMSKSAHSLEAESSFPAHKNIEYKIRGTGVYNSPGRTDAEGDWSNAAFWLCAGAMPGGNVRMTGLKQDSVQGDREICDILKKMGASVKWEGGDLVVKYDKLRATEIDGRAIPDLIPVLSVVASVARGTTDIRNASRLRIKESDRLRTTSKTLSALGANISESSDALTIDGVDKLRGGIVEAHGDHRIAMMAAVASAHASLPVTITGAQAVNKSYPNFWDDLRLLGKKVIEE